MRMMRLSSAQLYSAMNAERALAVCCYCLLCSRFRVKQVQKRRLRDRNRTWVNNEIDETKLCTTLFRDVCRDSSLLLSTVVSLPCEASTEAQTSDLELTRVSVNRFTAETALLMVLYL